VERRADEDGAKKILGLRKESYCPPTRVLGSSQAERAKGSRSNAMLGQEMGGNEKK